MGQPDTGQAIGKWAIENTTKLEVLIQARDTIDKNFSPVTGDFFVYGDEVFEVLTSVRVGDIFGQAEYNTYWKMEGKIARAGRFDLDSFKKLLEDRETFKESQVQKVFEQQRGLPENDVDGATADRRQMRERLKDDFAEIALGEGPRKINSKDEEDISDETGEESSSSFYDE